MRPRAGAALAALVVASAGCVLLVPSREYGDHCVFHGDETACAVCLETRCQKEIDDACGDDAVLGAVESCARAGDASCGALPASSLATCLSTSCPAVCYTHTGTSTTKCSDAFLAPGLACSCELGPPANDMRCSREVYPRTRCCAPAGWPSQGQECTCKAVICVPTSDGCNCTLSDDVDANSSAVCSGSGSLKCCAIEDSCQCRQRDCVAPEREVAQCDLDALGCPTGQNEQVAGCSIATP